MDYIEKPYTGKRLNPACEYYKIVNRGRLSYNAIICELCKYISSIRLKNSLYRSIGVKIGRDVVISPFVQIDPFFPELITLDDGVIIGWGAAIFTHEFTQNKIRIGKVHIKEKALIGGYSIIRSGVVIGKNATVAIKSYVKDEVRNNEFVGGIPAKTISRK